MHSKKSPEGAINVKQFKFKAVVTIDDRVTSLMRPAVLDAHKCFFDDYSINHLVINATLAIFTVVLLLGRVLFLSQPHPLSCRWTWALRLVRAPSTWHNTAAPLLAARWVGLCLLCKPAWNSFILMSTCDMQNVSFYHSVIHLIQPASF